MKIKIYFIHKNGLAQLCLNKTSPDSFLDFLMERYGNLYVLISGKYGYVWMHDDTLNVSEKPL